MHAGFVNESSKSYKEGVETYQGQKEEEEQLIAEKREQIKHAVADRLCAEIDIAIIKAMHEGRLYANYEYTEFFSPIQFDEHGSIAELIETALNAVRINYERQGYRVMWLQHDGREDFKQTNITVSWGSA